MSQDVVQKVKDELIAKGENLDHQCGAFKITSTVAWRKRHEGWGLIHSDGNGCNQTPTGENFRADTVMKKDGSVIDMLGNAESNNGQFYPEVPHESYNIPQWNPTGGQPPENWREPYDPGFLTDTVEPPDTSEGHQEILTAIVESEERINIHTTYETDRVLAKMDELRQEVLRFAEQAEEFLKKLAVIRRGEEPPSTPTKPKK